MTSPVPSRACSNSSQDPSVLSKRPANYVRSQVPWQCGFSLETASTHSSVLEHSQDMWEAGREGDSCPGHRTRSCICHQNTVGLSRSRHPAHSLPGMRRLPPAEPTPMLYAAGQVVGSSKSARSASKEAVGRVSKGSAGPRDTPWRLVGGTGAESPSSRGRADGAWLREVDGTPSWKPPLTARNSAVRLGPGTWDSLSFQHP